MSEPQLGVQQFWSNIQCNFGKKTSSCIPSQIEVYKCSQLQHNPQDYPKPEL